MIPDHLLQKALKWRKTKTSKIWSVPKRMKIGTYVVFISKLRSLPYYGQVFQISGIDKNGYTGCFFINHLNGPSEFSDDSIHHSHFAPITLSEEDLALLILAEQ